MTASAAACGLRIGEALSLRTRKPIATIAPGAVELRVLR